MNMTVKTYLKLYPPAELAQLLVEKDIEIEKLEETVIGDLITTELLVKTLKELHNPFSHDYVKNEKECKICQIIARTEGNQ